MYILKILQFVQRLCMAYLLTLRIRLARLKARRRARREGRYMMVLLYGGRPIVLSAREVEAGLRSGLFRQGFSVHKARRLALYIAYPPARR